MAGRPYLVLFDIDGTLLNSGGCGRAATERALVEVFGTTGALDRVNFAGKTDWEILREALEPVGIAVSDIDARLTAHSESVARHLTNIIANFPVKSCAGAPEVVAALRDYPGVVMGLVTGNVETLAPIKLRAADYDPVDFVTGAYGSEGWTRAMLPPLALERARVYSGGDFRPENIVIIGDTPGDILCATSINARTIGVATGPYSMAELRQYNPDHVFESMRDYSAVLNAILHNNGAS